MTNGTDRFVVLAFAIIAATLPSTVCAKEDRQPPQPISQVAPTYPMSMRGSGLKGEATIIFTVNTKGNVVDASAIRATNEEFATAAMLAVLQWKFEPGRVKGKPVNMRMQVPVVFRLENVHNGGFVPYELRGGADQSALPETLRYDEPPQPTDAAEPVYPFDLLVNEVDGSARVAMLVDSSGNVARIELIVATHPEFGEAMMAAAALWRFAPARKGDQPTNALISFERKFSARGGDGVSASGDARLLAARIRKKKAKYYTMNQVDSPPKAVATVPPEYPPHLLESGEKGIALVEVFIDEGGRALLPRVVSASRSEFGYAAAQAVSGWVFKPGSLKKRAVLTRVQIPFDFSP